MATSLKQRQDRLRELAAQRNRDIGLGLKTLRVQARIKSWYVASRLGISPPLLSGLENGTRMWTRERIAAFRKVIREETSNTKQSKRYARKKSGPSGNGR